MLGDDSDSEVKIGINKGYADRYNSWRQKEELQKLKDRYGEASVKRANSSSNDSSSSSEEDEHAEQLTEQLEKDFFKALSCLKKKDPSIYDEKVSFFPVGSSTKLQRQSVDVKKTDKKPLFLRDYERKLIVEREGQLSEGEDEDNDECSTRLRPQSPTIAEEEKLIKESLKGALRDSDDDDDGGGDMWGRIFQKRHKTQAEAEKEEEDYREWLKGQKEELSDKKTESELKYLHDYWNDPKLDTDELFLKDYLLNKRFLEINEDDDGYIPTYDEIVHDSDNNLSEDEKTIEKQDEFEHKYNFRFEEPDKEFIKRYPRTMENSLRKHDDRRKRKRQEVKERKEAEEGRKREEIKRLKSLKRKEIMEKIEKLKKITGNAEVGFKDEDLEGDFDPEKYDKRMSELFNYGFYEGDESEKPEFPELDEELEIENWNTWNERNDEIDTRQNGHEEPHCEDPDFNMDCDYDPTNQIQNELIQLTKRKNKGKKWNKFAQAVVKKKPVFDSNSHTFDEYFDEYYKLDFEDIIGDMPCRFKYRDVMPNNFGLTIDEILKADDKELNKWCSLKKAVQHRPQHVEKYDVHAYYKKAKNERLKKNIFHSLYSEEPPEHQTESEETKRKQSRKRKNHTTSCTDVNVESDDGIKRKKKEVDDCISQSNETGETESGDIESKKVLCSLPKSNVENDQSSKTQKKKKKKKKKKNKNKTQSEGGGQFSSVTSAETQSVPATIKKKKTQSGDKFSCVTSAETRSIPVAFKKHTNKKVSGKQYQKVYREKDQSEKQENSAISDARLRAYGINPKKFKNKLKYGNK